MCVGQSQSQGETELNIALGPELFKAWSLFLELIWETERYAA